MIENLFETDGTINFCQRLSYDNIQNEVKVLLLPSLFTAMQNVYDGSIQSRQDHIEQIKQLLRSICYYLKLDPFEFIYLMVMIDQPQFEMRHQRTYVCQQIIVYDTLIQLIGQRLKLHLNNNAHESKLIQNFFCGNKVIYEFFWNVRKDNEMAFIGGLANAEFMSKVHTTNERFSQQFLNYILTKLESESITIEDQHEIVSLNSQKSIKTSRSHISTFSAKPPSQKSFIHNARPIKLSVKLSTRRQKEVEDDNISYSKYYESVSAFNENDHLKDGRGKSIGGPVQEEMADDNSSMSMGLDKLVTKDIDFSQLQTIFNSKAMADEFMPSLRRSSSLRKSNNDHSNHSEQIQSTGANAQFMKQKTMKTRRD